MLKLLIFLLFIKFANSFIPNNFSPNSLTLAPSHTNSNSKFEGKFGGKLVLWLTKRSQLHGFPKPRKLHKPGFWSGIFEEEVARCELGPPCKLLSDDIIKGKRRPRFTLKKTKKQMYATIVDDVTRNVLCFMATNFKYLSHIFGTTPTKQLGLERNNGGTVRAAYELGKLIGRQALSRGISKVFFDRNHYRYHGRVEALAIGARKVGLNF